ncbi:MAG: sugar kinase [Lentisphaeria bacterium]|nr:sugar kinase [Lentisphaeria bacterium]
MNEFCIAGFGEVMLRICPPGVKRFAQAFPGTLESSFGGGEANVCASIAILGGKSRYLTALPDNPVARAFAAQMRGLGSDVEHIKFTASGRMGVYFAEHGSNMRGSNVVYDREGSVISRLGAADYDFDSMLNGVTHLHLSGITPSLSKNAFGATLAIAEKASAKGISISIDLNYRKKLWNWEPGTAKNVLACRCMEQIVRYADIIIGNEEDASDVFGINAPDTEIDSGKLNISGYKSVASALSNRFKKAKFVAVTLRESYSANHNNWGGMLYDCNTKEAHFAPLDSDGNYVPYEIRDIVDRFGGGDSFCAGLLFALNTPELSTPATAIRFAVAASALKHTINTDYNCSSRSEVENLMTGSASGRVQR